MKFAIRGFLNGAPRFKKTYELVDAVDADDVVGQLARQHTQAIADGVLDMIEIEFLDEPNPLQRFVRIGTNPAGMILPLVIL